LFAVDRAVKQLWPGGEIRLFGSRAAGTPHYWADCVPPHGRLARQNVSGLPTHDLTHAFSLTRRVNDLPHLSPRQIARWTLSFSWRAGALQA